jgi:hypothetical protein
MRRLTIRYGLWISVWLLLYTVAYDGRTHVYSISHSVTVFMGVLVELHSLFRCT